jgi:hypothetical protein
MYEVNYRYDCVYIYAKNGTSDKLANKLGTVFYGCFKIKTGYYYIPRTPIYKSGFNGFVNLLIQYV